MTSTVPIIHPNETSSYADQDPGCGDYNGERGSAIKIRAATQRNTHILSVRKATNAGTGQSSTSGGSKAWQNVLYGRQEKDSTGIPLLVRSLDPTRTVRDLEPEHVIHELQTEASLAPGSYSYMRLTRGGLLALGARTAEVAVRSQRIRCLDGTPVEVAVPLWHGHNAAKIRRVPAWINDAAMRESLYESAGVVSARRLVAYGTTAPGGRRRDKPQTSVVLVFRPELSRVPGSVTLCGVEYAVEPYSPPPTQCMRCQRFGHEVAKCPAQMARCKVCAGPHDYRRCDFSGRRLKCANCEGAHAATFAMCPLRRSFYATDTMHQAYRRRRRVP
ncbi:hypothetical protein MTO96_040347 [Rhipicephalus appendiculatus]